MTFSIAFYVDSVPFTRGVIDGTVSLGGSESACLGLARALQARGHRVSIYATQLDTACFGLDRWGVQWIPAEALNMPDGWQDWDVFVSLRMPAAFGHHRQARLRVLWNQDLMANDTMKGYVMACAWAYDKVAYVSQYHRTQWEGVVPELTPLGYVTRNGFDQAHVPTSAIKDPRRIIHISRPERGLEPLLDMWPLLKYHNPEATLQICRYSSMYDKDGWGEVCAGFDKRVEDVNAHVGGITYLGELGKADLYKAISDAAVMWYPGVPDFAETSCIAAIEAQACGTPFVGSFKGALAETVPSGILIKGDAYARGYQQEAVDAIVSLLDDCQHDRRRYRELQKAGREHVQTYTYDVIAAEWEQWLTETFQARYESNKLGIMRQLLHYDDHTAAQMVAEDILGSHEPDTSQVEALVATKFCDRVIAGKEHTPETYAQYAFDPLYELSRQDFRLTSVVAYLKDCTHVLDVACGNGSFALGLCQASPTIRVTAVDYSPGNIARAQEAAQQLGFSDRVTFICAPVWDFDLACMSAEAGWDLKAQPFDGLWCGEFAEHIADCTTLIDSLERVITAGAKVCYTVPYGPLGDWKGRTEPHPRSHVHHFRFDDIKAVWGEQQDLAVRFMPWPGNTARESWCGQWLITYRASGTAVGQRPYAQHIVTTRPYRTLSVGIIASNAELEIGQCLDSIWAIADEIVVGLCGSTDETKRICETFDAGSLRNKIRTLELPSIEAQPDGFSGARNAVLATCTGDWHLMIDTDERLMHPGTLLKYLDGGAFIGFVIRQNHLLIDAPNHFDVPVRVFKRSLPIWYYGCVHEQPQLGDCNGEIHPALEVADATIAHTGYLMAHIRRQKLFGRNLALVARDQERFPDRKLGKLILERDCMHLGDEERQRHRGEVTPDAESYYRRAVQLFQEHFADPGDKFHELARPFYEGALKSLGKGTEVEWSLAGKPGGLNGQHAKPHRFWVQDARELETIVLHKLKRVYTQMQPAPVAVDPVVEPQEGVYESDTADRAAV